MYINEPTLMSMSWGEFFFFIHVAPMNLHKNIFYKFIRLLQPNLFFFLEAIPAVNL